MAFYIALRFQKPTPFSPLFLSPCFPTLTLVLTFSPLLTCRSGDELLAKAPGLCLPACCFRAPRLMIMDSKILELWSPKLSASFLRCHGHRKVTEKHGVPEARRWTAGMMSPPSPTSKQSSEQELPSGAFIHGNTVSSSKGHNDREGVSLNIRRAERTEIMVR